MKDEQCQIITVRGEVCIWNLSSKITEPATAGTVISNPSGSAVITNLAASARVKYNGQILEVPESNRLTFNNGNPVFQFFNEAPHFFAKRGAMERVVGSLKNAIKSKFPNQETNTVAIGVRG